MRYNHYDFSEHNIIDDFVETELSNSDIANDLFAITTNENINACEYECNRYSVYFDRKSCTVVIVDEVSKSNGIPKENCMTLLPLPQFLLICKIMCE